MPETGEIIDKVLEIYLIDLGKFQRNKGGSLRELRWTSDRADRKKPTFGGEAAKDGVPASCSGLRFREADSLRE